MSVVSGVISLLHPFLLASLLLLPFLDISFRSHFILFCDTTVLLAPRHISLQITLTRGVTHLSPSHIGPSGTACIPAPSPKGGQGIHTAVNRQLSVWCGLEGKMYV